MGFEYPESFLLDALVTRTGWKLPQFVKIEKRETGKGNEADGREVAKASGESFDCGLGEEGGGESAFPGSFVGAHSRYQRAKDKK